jgi:hypothetical protein
MATWWVCARTNPGVPAGPAALADVAGRAAVPRGGIELTNYDLRGAALEVEVELPADNEEEARERALAWLADLSTNATWFREAGVTLDFESDDGDSDYTDIHDVFSIVGIEEKRDGSPDD